MVLTDAPEVLEATTRNLKNAATSWVNCGLRAAGLEICALGLMVVNRVVKDDYSGAGPPAKRKLIR